MAKTTTKIKAAPKPEPKAKESSSTTRPNLIADRLLTAEGWKRLMMADAKKGKK